MFSCTPPALFTSSWPSSTAFFWTGPYGEPGPVRLKAAPMRTCLPAPEAAGLAAAEAAGLADADPAGLADALAAGLALAAAEAAALAGLGAALDAGAAEGAAPPPQAASSSAAPMGAASFVKRIECSLPCVIFEGHYMKASVPLGAQASGKIMIVAGSMATRIEPSCSTGRMRLLPSKSWSWTLTRNRNWSPRNVLETRLPLSTFSPAEPFAGATASGRNPSRTWFASDDAAKRSGPIAVSAI